MSSGQPAKTTEYLQLARYQVRVETPFRITTFSPRAAPRYQRDGHWNERQKLKYAIFLSFFRKLFQRPSYAKSIRLYEMMSDLIVTRNPNQCRSHHQKMEKHRNSIKQIISSVSEKYQPRIYQEMQQKYLVLLKCLLQNQQKYIRAPSVPAEVKMIQTKQYVPASGTKKKQRVRSYIIQKPSAMPIQCSNQKEIPEDKNKQAKDKTADSYQDANLDSQEDQKNQDYYLNYQEGEDDQSNPPSQLNQDSERHKVNQKEVEQVLPEKQQAQVNSIIQIQKASNKHQSQQKHSEHMNSHNPSTFVTDNKKFYEQQMGILEIQKKWHIDNIKQLEVQLDSQKQLVRNCEAAIHLYRLALSAPLFIN